MTSEIKYTFSKKKENKCYSVSIRRYFSCENNALFIFEPSTYSQITLDCSELERRLFHYNDNPNANYRESFDSIFPDANLKAIGRVIGITSSLGHYFIRMKTHSILVETLNASFSSYFDGHCFIDWMDGDNQIIFFPSEEFICKWQEEMDGFFDLGLCGKMECHFPSNGEENNPIRYYFESKDINSNMARVQNCEFVYDIICSVNKELRKRFPSNEYD